MKNKLINIKFTYDQSENILLIHNTSIENIVPYNIELNIQCFYINNFNNRAKNFLNLILLKLNEFLDDSLSSDELIEKIKNCNIKYDKLEFKYDILFDTFAFHKINSPKNDIYVSQIDMISFNDNKSNINSFILELVEKINNILKEIESFEKYQEYLDNRLKSSKIIHFNNEDIIITDPCYIIREKDELTDDDWAACDYGYDMEALGFNNYLTKDTIYGDWSCTTFNSDTNEILGKFCADAGLVSVFSLKEILKYNPNYDYQNECNNGIATLIKNFTGDVEIIVKKNEKNNDYDVNVEGKGNVNFTTKQTEF